jgi:hypothetical protein
VLGHPVDPTAYGTPQFPLDNLGAIIVRSQVGHITIDGNTVLDSPATCIKAGAPSMTVSNNYVSGCGSDFWTHGIYIAGPDARVVNNTVERVPDGFGIHVWGSHIGGAQIISNTVRDLGTPWAAIVVGGGGITGTVISGNALDINPRQRAAIMLYGGPYTITDNIVMALDASPTFTFIKYEDRSSDGTPPGPYVVRDNTVYIQAVTRTSQHT